MSSVGEQLYRLRRRVALAQYYNDYTNAQADPHGFLYPDQNKELSVKSLAATRKRKRASSGAKRRGNRLATLVHDRIVDLMFPSLVHGNEDIESEEAEAKGEEKVREEKRLLAKKSRIREPMEGHGLRWSKVSTGKLLFWHPTRFYGAKPHMKQRPKQNANINNSTKNRPILMKLTSKDWES
jgi:hypothetical protein